MDIGGGFPERTSSIYAFNPGLFITEYGSGTFPMDTSVRTHAAEPGFGSVKEPVVWCS